MKDERSGRRIRQITSHPSIHHHPFFFVRAYDDAMQKLVFVSYRTGLPQIFFEDRASGVNAVRTYTLPPCWLLDVAQEHGLRVLAGVGLAGEQLVAFLDNRDLLRDVRRRCAADVRACANHPAVLGYAVGTAV